AAYVAYLRSAVWLRTRAGVLRRAGGRCERCGGAALVEVHHRSYERGDDERPGDLEALCAPCHPAAHAEARGPRTPARPAGPRAPAEAPPAVGPGAPGGAAAHAGWVG